MIRLSICKNKHFSWKYDNPFYELIQLTQKGKVFPVQAIKAYMGRRGAAPFLTLAVDGCEWLTSRPGHVLEEKHWYPLNRRQGKPHSQSWHVLSLPPFKPEPSSLQQVTITNILHHFLPNCQVTTRSHRGQMQLVNCQFDMPVVHAAIPEIDIVIYGIIEWY